MFDGGILEHRNLLQRIESIHRHRHSEKEGGSSLVRSKNKWEAEQKKRVELENRILRRKIQSIKKGMMDRKQLRGLYAEHDRMVSHVRRLR